MIFDVRTYDILMGRVPEYMEAVREAVDRIEEALRSAPAPA